MARKSITHAQAIAKLKKAVSDVQAVIDHETEKMQEEMAEEKPAPKKAKK